MLLLDVIRNDWSIRLPYRLRYNRYRGLSRPSYALLCFLYYLVKACFLLYFFVCFWILKFVFYDFWVWVLNKDEGEEEDDDEEEEETAEQTADPTDEVEELPFCQLFIVSEDMSLLVDHVEMCPDETAFIRVVDDEGYTPLYKRKVRRDKKDNRYLVFSGKNYYLDDRKTQPTVCGRK